MVAKTESWSRRLSGTWVCHLFLNPCPLPRTLQFLCTLTETPGAPPHSCCFQQGCLFLPVPWELPSPWGPGTRLLPLPHLVTPIPPNLPWAEPLLDSYLGKWRTLPPRGPSAPSPDSHFMTSHSAMVSPTQPRYSHLIPAQVALTSRAPHSFHPL